MRDEILRKLSAELARGIRTEPQVVYLLVGLRKLIERDGLDFPSLTFHCNWALHAQMDRAHAQRLLNHFDALHVHYVGSKEDPPEPLASELISIAVMSGFRQEFERILLKYQLPPLKVGQPPWSFFMKRYLSIISDIPLVVRAAGLKHISHVTMTFKDFRRGRLMYSMHWKAFARDDKTVTAFTVSPRRKSRSALVG